MFGQAVIVITGAGSGIGRALAMDLSAQGALLALSDVDAGGLHETARQCVAAGARVLVTELDVSDRSAMQKYVVAVLAEFGHVDFLFNNAGIIFTGDVDQTEYEDIQRVIDVDFWGVVHGTTAFLPHLIDSGVGAIVNISSAYGLISAPSYSAYNAAKFAVSGFTHALQQEARIAKWPLHITCVYPGAIQTSILRTSRAAAGQDLAAINRTFESIARTTPEQASKVILRGVRHRKRRILIGPDARAVDLLGRLLPVGYQRLFQLARFMQAHSLQSPQKRREGRAL